MSALEPVISVERLREAEGQRNSQGGETEQETQRERERQRERRGERERQREKDGGERGRNTSVQEMPAKGIKSLIRNVCGQGRVCGSNHKPRT